MAVSGKLQNDEEVAYTGIPLAVCPELLDSASVSIAISLPFHRIHAIELGLAWVDGDMYKIQPLPWG